jgi:hypothetical protein
MTVFEISSGAGLISSFALLFFKLGQYKNRLIKVEKDVSCVMELKLDIATIKTDIKWIKDRV